MPNKIKIKVESKPCGCCWQARFDGPAEDDLTWINGDGDNIDEAIGNLIRQNSDFFGIEIETPYTR